MKFRRTQYRDNLRLNLTPLIDMVFLLLVFFMMTTTFNRESQLEINLPEATSAESTPVTPSVIRVVIDAQGQYSVDNSPPLIDNRLETLVRAMERAVTDKQDPVVMISADAFAQHQMVIRAMEAAKELGLLKLTFEAQDSPEE